MKATTPTSTQEEWKQRRSTVRNPHGKMQFKRHCAALLVFSHISSNFTRKSNTSGEHTKSMLFCA